MVVSLKRRADRLAQFWANLDEFGWPLLRPTVFDAIDGGSGKVPCPPGFTEGGGAWGCLSSHRQILERAIMDDVRALLVLEDDAYLRSDSVEQLVKFLREVPDDWDGLMLGGQHIDHKPRLIKPGIVQCGGAKGCQRTHAYAVRGNYMRELYSTWSSPTKATVHCDWLMGPLHSKFRVYAPDPFVLGQEGGKSDISGRNNPRKSWDQPPPDLPVLLLDCPRQVVAELRRRHGVHTGYDRCRETDVDKGLIELFKSKNPLRELGKWIDSLQWEVYADEGLILGIWHPDASEQIVRKASSGPVTVITAETTEEAVRQLPERKIIRAADTRSDVVVLLRAPRPVVAELREKGWHTGHWRDGITDQDNGLRAIYAGSDDRNKALWDWFDCVAGEAERAGHIVTVWHPDADAAELRRAFGRPVLEITATTAADAVRQYQEGAKNAV